MPGDCQAPVLGPVPAILSTKLKVLYDTGCGEETSPSPMRIDLRACIYTSTIKDVGQAYKEAYVPDNCRPPGPLLVDEALHKLRVLYPLHVVIGRPY